MGQLKTNDFTEELITEIQGIWSKIGDPDMSRVTVVNCALSEYRDELKETFKAKLTESTKGGAR
jgi:hypothetical protein